MCLESRPQHILTLTFTQKGHPLKELCLRLHQAQPCINLFSKCYIRYFDFFLYTFEYNREQIKFLTPIHLYLLLYHKRTNSGINFEIHQVPHPEDKQFTIADWQYDQPVNPFVSHGNQIIRNTVHSQGTVVISVGYSVQQIKVCVRKIRKIVLSLY